MLPQIAVFGRQLGVSATVMGFLLSLLPFLYFFAKPGVGILADYFSVNIEKPHFLIDLAIKHFSQQKARKFIFLSLVCIMTLSYAGYLFLPQQTTNIALNVTQVWSCDYLVTTYCHFKTLDIDFIFWLHLE